MTWLLIINEEAVEAIWKHMDEARCAGPTCIQTQQCQSYVLPEPYVVTCCLLYCIVLCCVLAFDVVWGCDSMLCVHVSFDCMCFEEWLDLIRNEFIWYDVRWLIFHCSCLHQILQLANAHKSQESNHDHTMTSSSHSMRPPPPTSTSRCVGQSNYFYGKFSFVIKIQNKFLSVAWILFWLFTRYFSVVSCYIVDVVVVCLCFCCCCGCVSLQISYIFSSRCSRFSSSSYTDIAL